MFPDVPFAARYATQNTDEILSLPSITLALGDNLLAARPTQRAHRRDHQPSGNADEDPRHMLIPPAPAYYRLQSPCYTFRRKLLDPFAP